MANFRSKFPNLCLMMKAEMTQVINGNILRTPGEYLRFENGQYSTQVKKEIDFIRNHSEFGQTIFEDEEEKRVKTAARGAGAAEDGSGGGSDGGSGD
ncbi:MAG TPA: hypothetical protein VN462_00235 [Negativicutes bacterium]|nr:hypothetical protein [Negativicutes bacterium]